MAKSRVHPTERFLRALYGDQANGYVEIRGIHNNKSFGVLSRNWFQEYGSINTLVDAHKADHQSGLYFGVVRRDTFGSGKKYNCLEATTLWADIDCKNIGMDEEQAIKSIYALPGCLQPSALIQSGGGLHCYWFLDKPCSDHGLIEEYNAGMADLVSGDGIGDIARVLRLPGSINSKRSKPETCKIVWCWHWHRHSLKELGDALNDYPYVLALDGNFKEPAELPKPDPISAVQDLYEQTVRDRQRKSSAPGLTAFDRCRPGGAIGYMGREQALQAYVCARYAQIIGSRKDLAANEYEGIIEDAVLRIAEINRNYDMPQDRGEWERMARDRLYRFSKDYPRLKADDLKRKRAEKERAKVAEHIKETIDGHASSA
jgi:hypothetical protein